MSQRACSGVAKQGGNPGRLVARLPMRGQHGGGVGQIVGVERRSRTARLLQDPSFLNEQLVQCLCRTACALPRQTPQQAPQGVTHSLQTGGLARPQQPHTPPADTGAGRASRPDLQLGRIPVGPTPAQVVGHDQPDFDREVDRRQFGNQFLDHLPSVTVGFQREVLVEQCRDVVVGHRVHRDQRQFQPGAVGLDHGLEVFPKAVVVPRQALQLTLGRQQVQPGDMHGGLGREISPLGANSRGESALYRTAVEETKATGRNGKTNPHCSA